MIPLLLDDAWSPITRDLEFFRCDVDSTGETRRA